MEMTSFMSVSSTRENRRQKAVLKMWRMVRSLCLTDCEPEITN